MSRHALSFRYVDALPMIGFAPVFLWLWLLRVGPREVREFLGRAALTVTGYLRPRPDPALENVLRATFADLDRELARILGDRRPNRP
ncbi:MAG TPA: hypothetical protein VIZ43_29305 [Trebonia sp.]